MNIQSNFNQQQISFNAIKPKFKNLNLQQYKNNKKTKFVKSIQNKENFVSEIKPNKQESTVKNRKEVLAAFRLYVDIIKKIIAEKEKTFYGFMDVRAKILKEQEELEFRKGQEIYTKIIERCINDVNEAILSGKPKEEIQKLFKITEIFTTRYGHYQK